MVTFLCGCPELGRKEKTLTVFRLSCLCIGHFPSVLPSGKFGSAVSPSGSSELSEVIEIVQSYFFNLAVLKTTFSLIQVLLMSVLSCWTDSRVPHLRLLSKFERMLISVKKSAF